MNPLDQFFAPDFIPHSAAPGGPATLAGAKAAYQVSAAAFPDRKTTIEDLVAEGDQVAVRIRMTGTNKGGLPPFGIPANDRPVDIQWIGIYRLRDGKVMNGVEAR